MKIHWDDHADFYNEMAMMELPYTDRQLDCLEIQPTDTVLDVGCGPGRISILSARRAKRVTSLDASARMLEHLRENAQRLGVSGKIDTILIDWFDAVPEVDVQKHDIVIASRTEAMRDLEGLTRLARKYAAVMGWANAPSIPEIINRLYDGVQEERYGAQGGPPRTREQGYNQIFERVYSLGYEPNVKILPDGFTKFFANVEEALSFFWGLRPGLVEDRRGRLRENLEPYLKTEPDGRVTFLIETRSCVIWWNPEKDT